MATVYETGLALAQAQSYLTSAAEFYTVASVTSGATASVQGYATSQAFNGAVNSTALYYQATQAALGSAAGWFDQPSQTNWWADNAAILQNRNHYEARQAWEQEQERLDRARRTLVKEAEDKQRVVRNRARKLLVSALTPEQRRTYEDSRYFDVAVNGRTYRIHQGTHGNVRLLDAAGRAEVVAYCIQPDHVPPEDAMLAQLLTLKNDEPTFLRLANATRLTA